MADVARVVPQQERTRSMQSAGTRQPGRPASEHADGQPALLHHVDPRIILMRMPTLSAHPFCSMRIIRYNAHLDALPIEEPDMARLNISLPDDLRERMAGLNRNWSEIAQEAFEFIVSLDELKQNGKDVEAGLARLRADKNKNTGRQKAEGYQQGQSWALEDATFDQLEKAAALHRALANAPEMISEAVTAIDAWLDASSFELPGMQQANRSEAYARGFLEAAADLHVKI